MAVVDFKKDLKEAGSQKQLLNFIKSGTVKQAKTRDPNTMDIDAAQSGNNKCFRSDESPDKIGGFGFSRIQAYYLSAPHPQNYPPRTASEASSAQSPNLTNQTSPAVLPIHHWSCMYVWCE